MYRDERASEGGEVKTGENMVIEEALGRRSGMMLNRKRDTSEAGRKNGTKSSPDRFSKIMSVNLKKKKKIR